MKAKIITFEKFNRFCVNKFNKVCGIGPNNVTKCSEEVKTCPFNSLDNDDDLSRIGLVQCIFNHLRSKGVEIEKFSESKKKEIIKACDSIFDQATTN